MLVFFVFIDFSFFHRRIISNSNFFKDRISSKFLQSSQRLSVISHQLSHCTVYIIFVCLENETRIKYKRVRWELFVKVVWKFYSYWIQSFEKKLNSLRFNFYERLRQCPRHHLNVTWKTTSDVLIKLNDVCFLFFFVYFFRFCL